MRPIDADKIGLTDFEIFMCRGDFKAGLQMLLQKIEQAPTLDTVPVSVIEDIKAEIRKHNIADFIAVQSVLDIIDEYISGKGEE